MGLEANVSSSTSSSTSTLASTSGGGKRNRDPEDDVYIDNLNSHKRYLSEIMASSLNGLTVGDSLPDTLMDFPARSENMCYSRDEMPLQYSPMSEDSDDCRCCVSPINTNSSQPESVPTSPVSPYRYQRVSSGAPPITSYPLPGSNLPVTCLQRSDSEGRFLLSPSDICHSADLRRAALMRSVQMRTQSPGPSIFEMSFSPGQETEQQPCCYMKSLVDEREDHVVDTCLTSALSELETGEKPCRVLNMNGEKPCRVLNMNLKVDEAAD